MSLRGTCSALDWMHEMDVNGDSTFPFPISRPCDCGCCGWGTTNCIGPRSRPPTGCGSSTTPTRSAKRNVWSSWGCVLSQLSPPGEEYPLHLSQMEPIELEPVTVSDKEVVYRQLEANVAKTGVPRAIIDDHGGDLAGGVELFCQAHPETIEIYDISHKAACLLKARLEHDEQWKAFAAKAGQTKCSIQQTEWAFLVPPSQRLKARYMNLRPLITWGVKHLGDSRQPRA